MLVLSVRRGETTLITAPTGETISIVMLEPGRNLKEPRLGISVPSSYSVLHDDLSSKGLGGLKDTQVFQVFARGHAAEVVVADQSDQALICYQRCYPERRGLSARVIRDYVRYEWCSRLQAVWLKGSRPPFCLEVESETGLD